MENHDFLRDSAGDGFLTDAERAALDLELEVPVSSDGGASPREDEASSNEFSLGQEAGIDAQVPLTEAALQALQRDLGPAPVESVGASTAPSVTTSVATSGRGSKRHPVCAEESCVFSFSKPGQPCRVAEQGAKCMWCDDGKLNKALLNPKGIEAVNRALNRFQRLASPALAKAAAKLPANFQRQRKYCVAPDCCFSRAHPGTAARVDAGDATCGFCTFGEDGVLLAEDTAGGLRNLRASLALFARNSPDTLEKAWGRLSTSFKEGCGHYMDYRRQHRLEQRAHCRERQRMLACDPLLQRERAAMAREDYLRLEGKMLGPSYPRRPKPGDKRECRKGFWILQMPPPPCCHDVGRDGPEWRCIVNSTSVAPCPPFDCRICKQGYKAKDPRPVWEKYWQDTGLFEDPSPARNAAREAYSRDLAAWGMVRPGGPPELQSDLLKSFEKAWKRSRTAAANDVRGLFPFPDEACPGGQMAPAMPPTSSARGAAGHQVPVEDMLPQDEEDFHVLEENPALLDGSDVDM